MAGGGAEKVLLELVRHMDKKKFDVTVMTVVDTGVYVNQIEAYCTHKSFLTDPESIESFFGKLKYKFLYKLIYRLPPSVVYRWFIRDDYDVEVAFLEGFVTKVISCSNNRKSRKLAWVHTDLILNDYADKCYSDYKHHVKAYKAYHKILCVSKNVEEAFIKKLKIRDKTIVQHNPLDDGSIRLKSLEDIEITREKTTMVTVGRLVEQKGYDRLLRICKRLKEEGFEFCLWIVGEGEQRALLERYIHENSLEDTVKLIGFRANPYPYIKAADFFVCSSRAEGLSTVVTEAMILGKPVITTDCAGMRELLDEGRYGIITDNSSDSLYSALRDVLLDIDSIRTFGNRAAERTRAFDIRENINKIETILEMGQYVQ